MLMTTDHSRWDSGPAETSVENGSYRVKENLKGRLFILGVSSHANASAAANSMTLLCWKVKKEVGIFTPGIFYL